MTHVRCQTVLLVRSGPLVLDGSAVAERYFLGSQDDPHGDHHFPALESDSEYVGRARPPVGLPDKNGAWPRASAQWRTRSSAPPVSCCSSRRSTTTVSFWSGVSAAAFEHPSGLLGIARHAVVSPLTNAERGQRAQSCGLARTARQFVALYEAAVQPADLALRASVRPSAWPSQLATLKTSPSAVR